MLVKIFILTLGCFRDPPHDMQYIDAAQKEAEKQKCGRFSIVKLDEDGPVFCQQDGVLGFSGRVQLICYKEQ